VDEDVVDGAWEFQSRFRLSWFDCLLLSSADRLGCTHFLTEDMGADRKLGPLVLTNPFLNAVEDVLGAS
jgi:predicted nucleic acid-binding protein